LSYPLQSIDFEQVVDIGGLQVDTALRHRKEKDLPARSYRNIITQKGAKTKSYGKTKSRYQSWSR